jgi:hypothetical protein
VYHLINSQNKVIKMLLTIEEIQRKLADRNASAVSEKTGIHANTINAIKRGENVNPTYKVTLTLSNYLQGGEHA